MAAPSAAILAALEAGKAVWVHELDLPDGSVLRSSRNAYSAEGGRHYVQRVTAWGPIPEAIDDDGVPAPETWVELADDEDGTLAQLIQGRYRDRFERGVAYRTKVAAPGVAFASWWTVFSGVTTRPAQAGARKVRFAARVDDRALRTLAPRRVIGPSWPLAAADDREHVAAAIYGVHDGGSLGLSSGQVPTRHIDEIADVRLVQGGASKSVVRVYDDATQISGSNYTVSVEERKGWSWQAITFSVAPAGEVTCDVQGIEEDGDGGGALLTDAAEQLAHYLSNFVFGQATGTTWLATSSRIDATTLAAATAWLEARYYGSAGVSYYRGAPADGYTVLREWQESTGLRVWWRADGTLAFALPTDDGDPYYEAVVYRWASDDMSAGEWAPKPDDRDLCTGLRLRHAPCAALGSYLSTLEVRDPVATQDEVAELSLPWSRAA